MDRGLSPARARAHTPDRGYNTPNGSGRGDVAVVVVVVVDDAIGGGSGGVIVVMMLASPARIYDAAGIGIGTTSRRAAATGTVDPPGRRGRQKLSLMAALD